MKRSYVYLLIFYLFLMGYAAFSQQGKNPKAALKSESEKMVLRDDHSIALVKMKKGNVKNASQFINENRQALGLTKDSELIEFMTKTDKLGMTTRKYKQYHKGIEIEGAQTIFHQKGSGLESMNGRIVPDLDLDVAPSISERVALQVALDDIKAETYRWNIEGEESFQPKGVLKISSKNYSFKSEEMRLVYQFDIYATKPLGRYVIEIDAKTGEVVNKYDRIHNHSVEHTAVDINAEEKTFADVAGTGESWYNGTVNFTADDLGGSTFILRSNAKNIHTRTLGGGEFSSNAVDVNNSSSTFDGPNQKEAVSVHWALEASYDYFFDAFGISGYNNGTSINGYANYGTNQQNAFWNGEGFFFGDGIYYGAANPISTRPFVTLDIVGHEYTHAITFFESGLVYLNESGALNESFSDIFGHNIEVYKNPNGLELEQWK